MKAVLLQIGLASLGFTLLVGCSTAPTTTDQRTSLHDNATDSLKAMDNIDPGFRDMRHDAYAYAVFPTVGKGGLGLGGAYGHGEVYEHGAFVGFANLSQATIGAQIGGQTYTEVILFQTPEALHRFESGQLAFDANASAVALESGAGASAKYDHGISVIVHPLGGLMLEASIGGQSFNYEPASAVQTVSQAD